MIRRPPRSTLFPYTRSSDLRAQERPDPPHGLPVQVPADDRGPEGAGGIHGGAGEATAHQSVHEYRDRKSTRLNSSHGYISYAVFCLKKKKNTIRPRLPASVQ